MPFSSSTFEEDRYEGFPSKGELQGRATEASKKDNEVTVVTKMVVSGGNQLLGSSPEVLTREFVVEHL